VEARRAGERGIHALGFHCLDVAKPPDVTDNEDREQPPSISRIQHLSASHQQSAGLASAIRRKQHGRRKLYMEIARLGGGGNIFNEEEQRSPGTVSKTSRRTARYHGCFSSRQYRRRLSQRCWWRRAGLW